ncbi:MAG: AsmA family protein, partial [Aestuariivirga sp.]
PEVQSSAPTPVTLFLDHAAIRFFDQRSGQAFAFRDARMAVELSALGEMTLEGAATINAQHANFQAYVKDVARISARGSPAGFSLEAPALLASFNGRLGTGQGLGLAGTVNLSGPDLRQALRWAGGAPGGTMGLKDFSLSGGLDAKARAFGVHQALLNVDGISGSGDLTLDFRGEVPKFQAVIATDTIDLDTYIKPGTAKLGFSALRGIDGAARITAKGLNYSGLKFGPAKIAATLDHGRLDAQIFFNSASQAQITLDGASSVDGFTLAFNSNNADAGRLLEPFTGIGWLEGKGTIHATLSGNGKTREEMISTLKGEARIALTDGALKGLDVGQTLSATAREIQNGWPARAEAKTPFTSLEVSFTIADGIAAIKTLKLASPALAVSGSGETDFLRRALDLRVDPRLVTAKTGETAGLPVAIVVQGPWGSPRIYPDMPGILANPKAAYEALTARGLPQLPAN